MCLSQLTSLRGDSAVGIFDIMMVGFAVLSLLLSLRPTLLATNSDQFQNHALVTLGGRWRHNPVAIFWLLTIPLFAVAILMNLQGGRLQEGGLFKSSAPFVAVAIVSLAAADLCLSQSRRTFMFGFLLTTCATVLIYVFAMVTGVLDLYNVYSRFVGLSTNPNQTGFIALSSIIICGISYRTDFGTNRLCQIIIIPTVMCSMLVGFASKSDSFTLAIAPLIAYAALRFAQSFTKDLGSAIVLLLFFALTVIVAVLTLQPDAVVSAIDGFIYNLQYGNQDVDRITAWNNGILAWQESPIWGHGPGGWSGFSGPFEGVEAHNSYIDWLTIVGISGLGAYIFLLSNIFRHNLLRDPFRYVALVAILIFGTFGFFMRFPIYWLSIMIIILNVKPSQLVYHQRLSGGSIISNIEKREPVSASNIAQR